MPGYNTPNNTNQTNYPGTSTPVTHSYDERLTKIAEFDDALLDQATWRNSRYDGSKMTSKEINKFTPIHPDFALSTPTTSSLSSPMDKPHTTARKMERRSLSASITHG